MDANLVKDILIGCGVNMSDCSQCFNQLYKKLSDCFLTADNKEWFKSRYSEFVNIISCSTCDYSGVPQILFWELFSFGLLSAAKNGEAERLFNQLNINKCYLLQLPDYNLRSNCQPAYCLKGEYNVSLLTDDEDREMLFELLKKDIRQNVPIPFWAIDKISSAIGKEIYAFDDSMNWVLVLTHENEVYLYKSAAV